MKIRATRPLAWAVSCTRILIGVAFLLNTGFADANGAETTIKADPPKSIKTLRAFLYYQEKGTFSNRDIFAGGVALRNVIGGGTYDVETPSGAILILAGVRYPLLHKAPPSTLIKLIVKQGKKTLAAQEVPIREFFSEQDSIEVPFIVYRTGCVPLEIIASLVEQKRTISSLSRIADFNCGE